MKVLFLDVDGVLNNFYTKTKVQMDNGVFTGIDPRLVTLYLDWFNRRPEVKIVLSSSWRTDTKAKAHLSSVGISWIAQTPRYSDYRGNEIASWLLNNPATHVAILDDNADMLRMTKYLVQTSETHGLRVKDLVRVDKLLGYGK